MKNIECFIIILEKKMKTLMLRIVIKSYFNINSVYIYVNHDYKINTPVIMKKLKLCTNKIDGL